MFSRSAEDMGVIDMLPRNKAVEQDILYNIIICNYVYIHDYICIYVCVCIYECVVL